MKYKDFTIENYRAIVGPLKIDVTKGIVPLVGVNECGKTTILQAIFCFDYTNDDINEKRHLENILNLYETKNNGICSITATIEAPAKTIINILQEMISGEDLNDEEDEKILAIKEKHDFLRNQIKKIKNQSTKEIKIKRELSYEKDGLITNYSSDFIEEDIFSDIEHNGFCEEIVRNCPYILYNDDFNDRPSAEILITDKDKSDWQQIYERVFAAVDDKTAKENFNLLDIFDENENRRETILNITSNYVSEVLSKAWEKITSKPGDVSVKLLIEKNDDKRILKIKIEEKKNNIPHTFDLTNRSKGFIWYYNFIMKIQFNPKQAGAKGSTIFLLDEPGSYLHEAAQKELCKNLSDISKEEGAVIYCTHSPQLLNPEIIPPNKIKIVSKKNGSIISTNLTEFKTNNKQITSLQPVYEALGIPQYKLLKDNEKIVCVEGIYDKYAIELFCTGLEDVILFPSVNSDTIVNNISYFICYNIPYCTIWDNDKAGRNGMKKAQKIFGSNESKKFDVLPNENKSSTMKMEYMFEKSDFDTMASVLGIDVKNSYDKDDYQVFMSGLYFEHKAEVEKIKNKLSTYAGIQFAQLSSLIKSLLKQNEI